MASADTVTIRIEDLQRAFEKAIDLHYRAYPNSATVQSFLRLVHRDRLDGETHDRHA